MTIIMGKNNILFIGATIVEELSKWRNMPRSIMEFLIKWKNSLIEYATWNDDFFVQKKPHLINH
jgi:hypothetical protein